MLLEPSAAVAKWQTPNPGWLVQTGPNEYERYERKVDAQARLRELARTNG